MSISVQATPQIDPTPIFEHFRGSYATELLTAAVTGFDVFNRLARIRTPKMNFAVSSDFKSGQPSCSSPLSRRWACWQWMRKAGSI